MTLHVAKIWPEIAGFALTEEQLNTIEAILENVESEEASVVSGPAGTGKSTVTSALIVEAIHQGLDVLVAAPTHKAAKVLDKLLRRWEEKLGIMLPEPVTIHSLLRLVPTRGRPGQPDTLRQKGVPDLGGADLLIVDECSMIGKELYAYIIQAAEDAETSLLFMGDASQLQPVNEYRASPSFSVRNRFALTEVLRHDGAVLTLATRARKLKNPQVLPAADGSTEVRTYQSPLELKTAWLQELQAAHNEDRETPVMLCWTNEHRRKFNRAAREALFGKDVPDFMEGDQLVTLNAYMNGDTVLIANNVDVEVANAELVSGYKPAAACDYAYDAWRLWLTDSLVVYVIADHSRLDYKRDLRTLGEEIKTKVKTAEAKVKALVNKGAGGSAELRRAQEERNIQHRRWTTEYFPLKEAFIDVDFNYSCTIHKSQGSTYQDVFIWNDYVKSPERKELLYVAVTRAARSVHHLHVGLQRAAA